MIKSIQGLRCMMLCCALIILVQSVPAQNSKDPLPSWNNGSARQSIIEFVRKTTDKKNAAYVAPGERIATFDQDGTLWVEHPVYSQLMFCLDRVPAVVRAKPDLKDAEPFKTVLSGDRAAIAKLSMEDLEKIAMVTLTGMSVDDFNIEVKKWLVEARDPRWKRHYNELVYQPMLELLKYLRANGYKTYIVTGGGQDFVRAYSEQTYGIPPEQVIGTSVATSFGYDANGKPVLMKTEKLMLNDNGTGKPEGIHLMIGRRPYASFGNTAGDQQMLEYTKNGNGTRLAVLLLHDDATREYAYGPANGLPDTKVGAFSQALYDEAKKDGWVMISMKSDWKRIFPWQP
jgi:phosphoglycolate phosphatase-like HAD superfamily hydrolase